MMPTTPRAQRFLATALLVAGLFAAGVQVANAQLANLISSGLSAATGAALACNKDKISKGISSIFGGGGSSGLQDAGGNFDGLSDAGGPVGIASVDGPLDSVTTNGTETTIGGTSAFSGPSALPGFDTGLPTDVSSGATSSGVLSTGQGVDDGGLAAGSLFGLTSTLQAVPVTNSTLEQNAKKTAAATAATTKKLTCTNAIERAAAQTILKQLTISTVNWINNGFQGGGPLFLGDPTTFFKNIQDQIVKDFSARIGFDALNYPFGRMVVKQLADDLAGTFESHARYSLNQVVSQQVYGATGASFFADFATGGWDAFLALTSFNNNPYGFSLAAQDELSSRIADTSYSPAQDIKDQLTRNGGLLDLKRCTDPANYDSKTMPPSACRHWENQTPGSVISNQLNTALSSPFRQLELGQDLSADLTAIFDALANQLVSSGLRSLSTSMSGSTKTSSSKVNTYSNNGSYVSNVSVDGNGNPTTNFLASGNAYQTNIFSLDPSGFDPSDTSTNAKKRINLVGLINRQKIMIPSPAEGENRSDTPDNVAKAFGWSTAEEATWVGTLIATNPDYRNLLGRQINLTKRLIPAVLELDYCIPGPHPTWQADTSNNLQAFLADPNRLPQTVTTLPSWMSQIPIIGGIFAGVDNLNADKKNEAVYIGLVEHYLNVDGTANSKTNGYGAAVNIFSTLYNRYSTALQIAYSPLALKDAVSPSLVSKDSTEFNNLPTYMKAINGNAQTIASIQVSIDQLVRLGKDIHALETNTPALEGYPLPGRDADAVARFSSKPVTYDDYQERLDYISKSSRANLTEYGRALKRISDTFNLIAPDLFADSDVEAQEATLDAVNNKLLDLAGPGGDIEQCLKEVDAQTAGPTGRMPFPSSLAQYLPADFLGHFKTTASFLPDYYYGLGQGQVQLDNFRTKYGFQQDPKKTIQNDDVVTIDNQQYPNALSGLENLIGIY